MATPLISLLCLHLAYSLPPPSGYSLNLNNEENVLSPQLRYEVLAALGTPAQSFSLLLDTALSVLVVNDAQCWDCPSSQRFNRSASRSYQPVERMEIGGAAAELGLEEVVLGSMRVLNQTVVSVWESADLGYDGADGVLVSDRKGLSPGSPNIVSTMLEQGLISAPVFAVYFDNRYTPNDPDRSSQSVLSLGYWNLSAYSSASDFMYVPVNTSRGLWELTLTTAFFEEKPLITTPQSAIIDSTENRLMVPEASYRILHSTICNKLSLRCKDTTSKWNCKTGVPTGLPDITMHFGDIETRLTPENYIDVWSGQCHLRLGYREGSQDWVLGTGFMHEYYMLFDLQGKRVGLARVEQEERQWGVVLTLFGMGLIVLVFGVMAYVVRVKLAKDKSMGEPLLTCG